jgi:predicted transglutaminase-like cysteine proteinase
MLKRFKKKDSLAGNCKPTKNKPCYKKQWMGFLATLKNKNTKEKVKAVHKYMNDAEYILDIVNWGIQDYWATPYQFFVKDGDCEDYAIAKYLSLKSLGFPPNKMRVVVLQDTNLGVIHAILAVYLGGEILVLDNQLDQVVSDNKIHHYTPIYSINESGWWRHRKN